MSILPDILRRWTAMKVVEGVDGALIEANCVYVPPPHAAVAVQGGRLRVRASLSDAPREYRPIDGFFDSLAAVQGADAIGIVLSGTGSDGALGLKAIKNCGGFTIAQGSDGTSPQFDDMPSGAIATGAVDLIAPAEAIPSYLMQLGAGAAEALYVIATPEELEAARLEVCSILRTRLGHDFSGYRDKTFMRRVQRRMNVLATNSLSDYIIRLQQDHEEVRMLFRDLLIRVTSFFRDSEAFESVERLVMPRIFADKHADDSVRVWVPGCATGEEAYSLAILLREQMDRLLAPPKVQVFATDIDEPAIDAARAGRYPATLLQGLSEQRRERFFRTSPSGYVIAKEIRDLCTFSSHSIVRDPPFSRMNLISCRNLLIYMNVSQQSAIIPAFHYALVPDGVLLLGISESVARYEDLFESVDKSMRVFRRRDVRSPPLNIRPQRRSDATQSRFNPPRALSNGRKPSSQNATNQPEPPQSLSATAMQEAPSAGKSALLILRRKLDVMLNIMTQRLPSIVRNFPLVKHELATTQEQLQSITEEHQAAVEELRSANEELHSLNEELQSSNEELETSKEELQSVNEELNTVNVRLSEKVDELDHANSDLLNLFSSTQIATIFLDLHMVIRGFTPAVGAIYNLIPSDQGRPLTDIVCQLKYDGLKDDVRHVLETLQPLERRVTHSNEKIHYIMRILPYRAPDSTVTGSLVTFLDVTSIVKAEAHQRLLVDELNHRVKNMLTVVGSLASQTLRQSADLESFSEAFMGRVRALTASYTLLSRQNWQTVLLRDLLIEEIQPYAASDAHNIVMHGPPVRLAAAGALALGLAIHELATNALKYGALSTQEGTVTIHWYIEQGNDGPQLQTEQNFEQYFVLQWHEAGGPTVTEPHHRGFGRTLIERVFTHELSGEARMTFDPAGVQAILRAPTGASIALPASSEA